VPTPHDSDSSPAPAGLSRVNATALVLAAGATALMGVMFARVVALQLRPPERLLETVGTRVTLRPEAPVRGDIMDRRGRVLSTTRFASRLVVDPTQLERAKLEALKKPLSLDKIIIDLAAATGLSPADLGPALAETHRENDRRREILKAAETTPDTKDAETDAEIEVPEPPTYIVPEPGGTAVQLPQSILAPDELTVDTAKPKKVIRYLPLTGVLTDDQADAVRALKVPGVTLERVPVREYPGGSTVAPLVGRLGVDANGTVGAEKLLADRLDGDPGRIRFVRDAAGRPLWIGAGDVTPAQHGEDIRLSIDLEIQRIAQEELFRGVHDTEAAGGRCVVLDPHTGEVLAMVDLLRPVPEAADYPFVALGTKPTPGAPEYVPERRYKVIKDDKNRAIHPALGRNRCVESVYEPGSTFKAFVWAVITELGKVRPADVLDTENGYWITGYGREIKDVKARASQTWTDVLINSSNIGMGKGAERLSFAQLHAAVRRFGFGSKTGIGLPGESAGLVTSLPNWKITSQHSVAFGNEVAVTPVQMVRAFAAFAREGDAAGTIPPVRILAGDAPTREGDVVFRVLPPKIALLTRDALTRVAENMETSLANASPEEKHWRYAMFGKSGTSKIAVGKPPEGKRLPHGVRGYLDKQYTASFLAAGPTESPRVVVLVIIDDPGPKLTHTNRAYGSLTAGPVNRRIMERTLTYLGVPTSPGHEPPPEVNLAQAEEPLPPLDETIPASDAPPASEDEPDAEAGDASEIARPDGQ
jgi:cell division protein FtsI/penicillin-binding protein 2